MNKIIEINGIKFALGKLCKRKHDYDGKGHSLRLASRVSWCYDCSRMSKEERLKYDVEHKDEIIEINGIKYMLSHIICKRNHLYLDTDKCLRRIKKGGEIGHCIECNKITSKKWYSEHLEQKRASSREWGRKNSEIVKSTSKKWRNKYPEKVKANSKKWNIEHFEQKKINDEKWNLEHSEQNKINGKKRYEKIQLKIAKELGLTLEEYKDKSKSTGIKTIDKILRIKCIQYKKEKTYADCTNSEGNQLRFDYYVPKFNILIEYDGEQHYKPSKIFGGEETFIKTQEHDKRKNEYCLKNNIILIRIPYFAKNIEDYLLSLY